jgi:hypothetical protein
MLPSLFYLFTPAFENKNYNMILCELTTTGTYVNKGDEKAYALEQNQVAFAVICHLWNCYILLGRASS